MDLAALTLGVIFTAAAIIFAIIILVIGWMENLNKPKERLTRAQMEQIIDDLHFNTVTWHKKIKWVYKHPGD